MFKNVPPIYHYSGAYAQKHGELDTYQSSLRANQDCKKAIEEAIRKYFDGTRLETTAVAEVIQEYGLERALYVLANTVQMKDWDGRFSDNNKKRLGPIRTFDSEEKRLSYMVESHPAVLDGFISQLFEVYETEV